MRKSRVSQRGQAVLVILLVTSVILVIGLSAVSRSITDIELSQQTQESARALLVAQAGLEKAIKANASLFSETDPELNVQNEVLKRDLGGSTEFVFPEKVKAGEYVSFWFLPYKEDGSLDIAAASKPRRFILAWGTDSNTALEATVIYQSSGKFYSKRYIYGPNAFNGEETHFQAPSPGMIIDGINFQNSSGEISLDENKKPYLMQLRLLFNSSPELIGVISNDGNAIYQQGSCFISTATVLESGITRKLEQCQLWPTVPSIFNYLIFSGQSIGGGV